MKKKIFALLIFIFCFYPAFVFSAKKIQVISPNGGENWIKGEKYDIRWESEGIRGKVKIELRNSSGWVKTIHSSKHNDGVHTWKVPSKLASGSDYIIRIRKGHGKKTIYDDSDGPFSISEPTEPFITVTSPNGGEDWIKGEKYDIRWESEGIRGKVKIELRNSSGWVKTIHSSKHNDGVHTWKVPSKLASGSDYIIRIRKGHGKKIIYDDSDGPFSISKPTEPFITVISPNGGENWIKGEKYDIRWESEGIKGKVEIELRNSSGWVKTIHSSKHNDGVHTWKVPSELASGSDYIIRIRKGHGNKIIYDDSDGPFSISEPEPISITVTSPNGGESWIKGETHDITWMSVSVEGNVKITLRDAASEVSIIAESTENDGTYSWTVPDTIGDGDYLVRVTSVENTDVYDESDLVFTIETPPSITVTSPNGGEIWEVGSSQAITWTTTGTVGDVKIAYSVDSGSSWTEIIDSTSNSGTYSWTIPDTQSGNCLVRVEETDGVPSDTSDAAFSIVPAPKITVTSPSGEETWYKGETHDITWTSVNVEGNVKITLRDAASEVSIIAESTENDGTYSWTVPDAIGDGDYLVRVTSVENTDVYDESDLVFAIETPPSITVTSPNGGESWEVGSSQAITWTTTGTVGEVKIAYSIDSGSSWTEIIDSTANSGTYSWTVPDTQSGNCLVRVEETDGVPSDTSDAAFSIVPAPKITVTSPNGGETWFKGEDYDITWMSVSVEGNVKIALRNAASEVSIIAESTENDGTYPWTVPEDAEEGEYFVRIISVGDTNIYDDSDEPFSFLEPGPGTEVGGRISEDTTWTLSGSPYIVTSNVFVYGTESQTATLTIEPGVIVKFNGNYHLRIGITPTTPGALSAVGTASNPIKFTSNKATHSPGDWGSIRFLDGTDDSATVLEHCIVEYGGSGSGDYETSIYMDKANPAFNNCTIKHSSTRAMNCFNSSPTIEGGTISDNTWAGIVTTGDCAVIINNTYFSNNMYAMTLSATTEVVTTQGIQGESGQLVRIRGGMINRDIRWRKLGLPYLIIGNILVYGAQNAPAVKLAVDPGVEVKLESARYFQVGSSSAAYKGALSAVGTASEPIKFTSGNVSNPQPGDWASIRFLDGTDDSATVLEHCIVEYGGSGSGDYETSIYMDKANPAFNNCTIRYSSTRAMNCFNSSPTIEGGTISDNTWAGIVTTGDCTVTINNTYFSNNMYAMTLSATTEVVTTQGIQGESGQLVRIRGGMINQDMRWRKLGLPYLISGNNILIYGAQDAPAVKLTVDPGVEVKLESARYFQVGSSSAAYKGALSAVGTASEPIKFTSKNVSNPQPGEWGSIRFLDGTDDSATVLEHCIVEYGGSGSGDYETSIYMDKANPAFNNCTIRHSSTRAMNCFNSSPTIEGGAISDNILPGITTSGDCTVTINNTNFSNNEYAMSLSATTEVVTTQGIQGESGQLVRIRGGMINRDIRWRKLGLPYLISGNNILIYGAQDAPAVKLTVDPGVEVRLESARYLQVGSSSASYRGALSAVGTASEPIKFTSGNVSNPQPGDWASIRFLDGTDDSATVLEHCIVEYGGFGSGDYATSIYLDKANPTFNNCTIRESLDNGINCIDSNLTIMFSSIINNKTGIYSRNSKIRINHSNINDNIDYGVQNVSSTQIVDARFNWWGDSSGPSGQAQGYGDSITDNVAYEPWLGLGYSFPYYISTGGSTTKQLKTNGGLTYLFANAEDVTHWTFLIKDSSQQTVKTFSGTGKKIAESWDGTDGGGSPLLPGSYTYQIHAQRQSDSSEATPLIGQVTINPDYPIGYMTSPIPSDLIAPGTIQIKGTANDSDFKNYKLEYGNHGLLSTWELIAESTIPVTDSVLGSVAIPTTIDVPFITFRLTVNDNSGHTTVSIVTVALSIINLNINPQPFSPNDDGKKDTTTISATFIYESNWTLEIKDPTGQNVIRAFAGSGKSMSQEWDGKNGSFETQSSGVYPLTITAVSPSLPEPAYVYDSIILDITPPTAQITGPTEEELFSNIYGTNLVEIIGTASDDYFLNYTIEYGETSNPASWNLIGTYSTAVTSDKLGEWDVSAFANREYTIQLTVADEADNVSSTQVHNRVGHLRMTLSPHQLNTGLGGTVTITTEIPFTVSETIVIKDKNSNIRRTLIENISRDSAVYNDVWDGKDKNGVNLPHGEYYVIVTADPPGQTGFTLDLSNTGGERSEIERSFPAGFSPYEGEVAEITFNLSEPSEVELFVKQRAEAGRERNLLIREPLAAETHSIYWDGTDDNGALMDKTSSGLENVIVLWAYSLPDNGVVIHGERPEVTSLSVQPGYFCPDDKEFPYGLQINYSISKMSNVTIYIQNSQGRVVRTMNLGTQSAGFHTTYWDGRACEGKLADSGSYRIGLKAVDSQGSSSLIRFTLIILYY